jgi:flagellar basal-body rod protein FlgB
VRVLNNLFSPHLTNLQSALGKATQRQSLLTNNLANVNTPGYKRQDVDFDIVLAQEMGGANPALGSEGAAQFSAQQKEATRSNGTSMRVDGNNVDLEREVFALAETELRYQALTDMTASYFQGLKSAIREGR